MKVTQHPFSPSVVKQSIPLHATDGCVPPPELELLLVPGSPLELELLLVALELLLELGPAFPLLELELAMVELPPAPEALLELEHKRPSHDVVSFRGE